MVGQIAANANAALFVGSTAYLDTDTGDLPAATLIAVAGRGASPADSAFIISTFAAGFEAGASLYLNTTNGANTATGNSQRTGNGALGATVNNDPTGFQAYASRYDATRQAMDDLTTGLKASNVGTFRRGFAPGTFRIGSTYLDNVTTTSLMSFAAIYDRYLSDAEPATFYARLKAFPASKELAI